jgi:hypothetical protein
VALFLFLVIRFWHPVYGFTSFLLLDQSENPAKIPEVREQPVYVYPYMGQYDGQFYAQIAHHPLLNSPALRQALDNLPYRARRILPAALAWLLAGGNPFWIFDVYSALNIVAWLALAWMMWRLLEVRGALTWIAWAGVLFSAGALISVRRALTDLVALAFITAALQLLKRGRRLGSALAVGAGGLCRETSLLAVVGLFGTPSKGGGAQPERGTWGYLRRQAFPLLLAAGPLGAWLIYVRIQAGPGFAGIDNFTWPLVGFVRKWTESLSDPLFGTDPPMAAAEVLALLGITVQALYLCLHRDPRDPAWRVGATYVLLMALLGSSVWIGTPSAAYRVLLPMALAFNVMAAGRRSSVFWVLLGNLSVVLGVLSFRDLPPHDDLELHAVRSLDCAGIVRQGPGWYGQEHSERHDWMWTPDRGRLSLEAWPRNRQQVAVRFALTSVSPRTVTVLQDGAVCWSGVVGVTATRLTLAARLKDGRADLDFVSDAAPVPGIPGRDIRRLSFAVYDPRVVLDSGAKTDNSRTATVTLP